jgi:type II secretory pathway pseudopilin PulG
MLLAVLFMMALMVIVALAVAPSFILQAKRDREEEMIHRGTEYARAIRKYYRKFGQYPGSLEQLSNTNQIRFIRKRFKDPLTKDGQWKVLHYGDIASLLAANGGIGAAQIAAQMAAAQAGTAGAAPGSNAFGPLPGSNSAGDQTSGVTPALPQQQSGGGDSQGVGVTQPGAGAPSQAAGNPVGTGQSGFSVAPGPGQNPAAGGGQGQNAPGQGGNNNPIFGNTGVGGQTFGGGGIVGVASKSKDPTIRIFNKKKTYDQWQFIYSPMMEYSNVLLRGPYNGQTFTPQQVGIPAGQLNQGQGQQPGAGAPGFAQPNQQPNQQLNPGGQFPPDQSQPQPQPQQE